MHVNDEHSPKRCNKCRMQKMKMDGVMKCPNCDVKGEGTGQTIIVTEPNGEKGPVKIRLVSKEEETMLAAQKILEQRKAMETVSAGVAVDWTASKGAVAAPAGTVVIHVPVTLFPDLVMWARKLKLPKDWKEAEKIAAITNFQIEINQKLGGLQ